MNRFCVAATIDPLLEKAIKDSEILPRNVSDEVRAMVCFLPSCFYLYFSILYYICLYYFSCCKLV